MKKLIFLLILLIPHITLANIFIEKTVSGYKIKVIQYDLSSQIYDIKVVKTDDATNLGNLLKENNAITGINGVFFCPVDYSWCNTTKSFTDSERYIAGEKFATYLTTGDRAVFAWTKDKKPFIYQSDKINIEDEDKIYYGLGNYPLLLNEGKSTLEYYYDVGLIFNKLKYKSTRNFICSDKGKKNIYFGLVYEATIDELVEVLATFGCYDALNLDAGLSTSFMYNGKYLVGPQPRDILDAVAIERVGFNVKQVLEISDKITKVISGRMEKKVKGNKELSLKIIKNYQEQLDSLKAKIYEKYGADIIETNSLIGEVEKVGYKIELSDLKSLKMVYLINQINYNLKLMKKDIEKKIEEENKLQEELFNSGFTTNN